MTPFQIDLLTPDEVEGVREQLVAVYYAAFSEPPYTESYRDAVRYVDFFARQVERDGFRCLVARSLPDAQIVGVAYGYTSAPGQWWRDTISRALDKRTIELWLTDCFEFAEFAVMPSAQGKGVGGRLHDQLLAGLPHRTAVLSVLQQATRAYGFYRRRGWVPLRADFYYPDGEMGGACSIMGLDLRQARPRLKPSG